jgi:hypothetical protein
LKQASSRLTSAAAGSSSNSVGLHGSSQGGSQHDILSPKELELEESAASLLAGGAAVQQEAEQAFAAPAATAQAAAAAADAQMQAWAERLGIGGGAAAGSGTGSDRLAGAGSVTQPGTPLWHQLLPGRQQQQQQQGWAGMGGGSSGGVAAGFDDALVDELLGLQLEPFDAGVWHP